VPTSPPGTEPTRGTTTEGTTSPSASPPPTTAAPTPTVTLIPSTVPDYTETLSLAAALLEDAESRIKNQPVESWRLLGVLSDTLAAVPAEARADGIDQSAGEMLAARQALIDQNEWHLCESHRVAAETPWQARDYETCLPLYEVVYQINPRYYTGYCAFRLGLCYEQLGAFEQALACYRTVQDIGAASPQYASALARIAAIG
jgi:tetratricopeptide (TPR) repeat protein